MVMANSFARFWIALAGLVGAEGSAHACSCILGAATEETKRHYVRGFVIGAAVIGRFEVIEQADHARQIGELIRPIEVYVGRSRPSYRLRYSEDPCSSSFETDRLVVLYRPERHVDKMSEHVAEERLADRLGEAAEQPRRRDRLASVRREIAARRPDAPSADYVDGGICAQLFLHDPGMLEMVREEAARAGRSPR
jgi:hypothetical protein